MKLLIAISLLASFLLFACDKDNCRERMLDTYSLESEYECTNTKYQLNIELSNGFRIIHSQAEYENLVQGDCDVEVDFDRFDLIIGKHGLTNGNVKIEYELTEMCDVDNYELLVTFHQNLTDIAPILTYHALVEKLGDGKMVEVTISEVF